MEYKILEKEYWERNLEITVDRSEIQDQLNKAFNEARSYIAHKGFRKGHVPLSIIKNIYGKEVEHNALGDIAVDFFNRVIKENKLSFIGEPKMIALNEKDNGFSFVFSYEIIPEFELADYHGLNVDEPVHRVTDEEIDKQIEEISINNGSLTAVEQITDEFHVASVSINEIDKDSGLPLIGNKAEQTDIFLHSPYVSPDLKSSLLNLKKGDSFRYKPEATDQSNADKTFLLTVNNIMKLVPVNITDEFVKTFTSERFTNLQDLRDDIGFQLQEQWNTKSRESMEEQIVGQIVKMNEFEVPKGVLFNVVEGMTEDLKKQYQNVPSFQNITAHQLYDDLKPQAEFRLKWEILRSKIAEKEGLKVEDYDLDTLIENEAKRRSSDPEKIREELMANPNVINPILYKKVLDLILDFAITNEVEFDEQGHYHGHSEDSELYDEYDEHDHDHEHHHDHDHEHHHDHDHEHETETETDDVKKGEKAD